MTDDLDLVRRINEACNGHPHAKIPWPHRLLHDARDCLTALLDENAALKRDNEQHAANYREVVGLKCELQERFDQLATQFTTTEASRDALAGKLGEVAEIISGYGTPGEKIGRIALITGNATIARSAEK